MDFFVKQCYILLYNHSVTKSYKRFLQNSLFCDVTRSYWYFTNLEFQSASHSCSWMLNNNAISLVSFCSAINKFSPLFMAFRQPLYGATGMLHAAFSIILYLVVVDKLLLFQINETEVSMWLTHSRDFFFLIIISDGLRTKMCYSKQVLELQTTYNRNDMLTPLW